MYLHWKIMDYINFKISLKRRVVIGNIINIILVNSSICVLYKYIY